MAAFFSVLVWPLPHLLIWFPPSVLVVPLPSLRPSPAPISAAGPTPSHPLPSASFPPAPAFPSRARHAHSKLVARRPRAARAADATRARSGFHSVRRVRAEESRPRHSGACAGEAKTEIRVEYQIMFLYPRFETKWRISHIYLLICRTHMRSLLFSLFLSLSLLSAGIPRARASAVGD